MTGTITVGFDGSAQSQAAVDWAALEAQLRGLPLRLVHVWRWRPHTLGTDPDKEHEWIEHVPRRAALRMEEHHPDLQVEQLNVPGVPADVLIDQSEESDLLVLGSRALSRTSGFLLGSVGQEVTARAERPVVLVRASYEDEEVREERSLPEQPSTGPVVVGLDLVQPSRAVLQFAFEAAALRGVELRAVHVWKLPPVFTYGPHLIDQHQRSELGKREHRLLSTALLPWREKYPQVAVDEQAVPGNAGRHAIEWAHEASLLVVGRRVRRPALGPRLGPVTQAALHHATPPVAVVPHT
ncbi:universal stress protein [Streptomyces smyrnaeus]|uniref:universal stress protein n=1 Tax=Streptomyces TaxID=1883 RepID=UPI000C1966D0|nr:universal stress protein [Streptomyces sp. B15]MBQ1120633.1 universal stress protein [Streptomyces sp. B15]MBQ1161944.1 universal stress protein [Streptomyces sp. A73]